MDSKTKKMMWRVVGGGIALMVIGFLVWIFTLPKVPVEEVASYNGLHWHAQLNIKIHGVPYQIPGNVNTDGSHVTVPHTHEANNILHYELSGIAKTKDITLEKFFTPWGKQFSSTCIIDTCVTGTSTLKMLVNGKENTEFENYSIKDKDVIEVILE